MSKKRRPGMAWGTTLAILAIAGLAVHSGHLEPTEPARSVIVQGRDLTALTTAVERVGGTITHELGVIDAVAAQVTDAQAQELRSAKGVSRLYADWTIETGGKPVAETAESQPIVSQIDADQLHAQNINGRGVTIAFVDTGLHLHNALTKDIKNKPRVLANYDAILNQELDPLTETDGCGHGAHVAGIAVDSSKDSDSVLRGIAPAADLVVVKAFGADGQGTYADVIRGIDWVIQHADEHYIRVLNLSISAPPRSHYWEDPLNQAVMAAWEAGIVVVVAAGNGGPDPMSVGVPGNVPYVITVGAMTDAYTADDGTDDRLAGFSATGPTYEGFVKPELVAPGGHVQSVMDKFGTIAQAYPEYYDDFGHYFVMSGTSQAAAVVTGVAAQVLQYYPNLGPDDIKCALMASARPAVKSDGTLAYSIFQQGAGLVNAYDAVYGGHTGCANSGMDVTKDLDGVEHYGGPANQDENGNFYLMGSSGDGLTWDGSYATNGGYVWTEDYVWTEAYVWTEGYVWTEAYVWTEGYVWTEAYVWTEWLIEPMSINVWVPQE